MDPFRMRIIIKKGDSLSEKISACNFYQVHSDFQKWIDACIYQRSHPKTSYLYPLTHNIYDDESAVYITKLFRLKQTDYKRGDLEIKMSHTGWRPATLSEALSFIAKRPYLQYSNDIVALGTSVVMGEDVRTDSNYALFCSPYFRKELKIYSYHRDLYSGYSYLAVKKLK
jgi:hypothetical protein